MILLILGLVLFFAVHSVAIFSESFRDSLLSKYGEGLYKGSYSLISLLGLVLIVWGYGAARYQPIPIWIPPTGLRHVALLLMLPVFPLLLATYFPGRIKFRLKHPMLVAIKFWALAHLLVNGTLADILLFGSFLVWAVLDRISLKKRTPHPIPTLPAGKFNDVIAVVAGLVVYVVFAFWIHLWLFGVAPVVVSR